MLKFWRWVSVLVFLLTTPTEGNHDSYCEGIWIGLTDLAEEGVWEWVSDSCESTFLSWADGEPNNWEDEPYVAITLWSEYEWNDYGAANGGPGRDSEVLVCGCQQTVDACSAGWIEYSNSSSVCYIISEDIMSWTDCSQWCDEIGADMLCIENQEQNNFILDNIGCSNWYREGGDDCSWWEDSILVEDGLWLGIGLPCFFVILVVFLHMSGIVTVGVGVKIAGNVGNVNFDDADGVTTSNSAYGRLLGADSSVNVVTTTTDNVDSLMNRWILRGSAGEIGYAIAILGLGVTMSLHVNGGYFSFYVDAFEAFVCCVCKIAIAKCASVVHKNLSPISRKVAGPWVKIFFVGKLLAAATSFILSLVFFVLGLDPYSDDNWCLAGLLFFCVLLASTVFQTITGFALYRIHVRAAKKLQNNYVFYEIVGCWWATLVIGQFGVGVCFWMIGAGFFIFETDAFEGIGSFFLLSSAFQVVTGVSMIYINRKVRAFFSSAEGANAIQMIQQNDEPEL